MFLISSVSALAVRLEAYNDGIYGPVDRIPSEHLFYNVNLIEKSGVVMANAYLRISNGLVVESGQMRSGLFNPETERAQLHDMEGKWIYPAFIDAWTHLGQAPIDKATASNEAPQYESHTRGAGSWNEAVTPQWRAINNPGELKHDELAARRQAGFSVVHVLPRDHIFRGTSFVRDLRNRDLPKTLIKADASIALGFEKGSSKQVYPDSLMGAIALIRQTFLDLRYFEQAKDSGCMEGECLVLQALRSQQLVGLPIYFEARDTLGALRALRIAREFGLKFAIRSDGLEYEHREEFRQLRSSLGSLILSVDYPQAINQKHLAKAKAENFLKQISLRELRRWEQAPANLQAMENSELPFAISFGNEKAAKEFWSGLRRALSYGLSPDQALRALTQEPAKILGIDSQVGTLEVGKRANFLVSSGDLFRRSDAEVLENWISGEKSVEADKEKDSEEKDTAKETVTETTKDIAKIEEAPKNADVAAAAEIVKADPKIVIRKILSSRTFPNMAYGWETLPQVEEVLIRNATLWTNSKPGILKNADILLRDGKIAAVGNNLVRWALLDGVKVIDATDLHVTPGIIDEHSHIAISQGVNEASHSVTSEVRIGDVLDPNDVSIYRLLGGGVTASQLLHGSANSIGGQSALIKLRWGVGAEDLKIKGAPGFIKFALGENVKQSNWGDLYSSRYPQTRMGVSGVVEDAFQRALAYRADKKAAFDANQPFPINLKLETLQEILENRRFITCHSYVQSEMLGLMELAEKMGFRVNTFTHVLEGYKIAPEMAAHGASASTFSDWWAYKFEVRQAIPYNASIMTRSGVNVAINSDDNEQAGRLNQEAAKAVKYGDLSEEEALKLVTLNPAKALHLDGQMGSLEVGKDADIVLWSSHPLSMKARAMKTFVDGRLYFDRDRDLAQRSAIEVEKQELWDRMQKSIELEKLPTLKKEEVEKRMKQPSNADHKHQHRCEEIHNEYNR